MYQDFDGLILILLWLWLKFTFRIVCSHKSSLIFLLFFWFSVQETYILLSTASTFVQVYAVDNRIFFFTLFLQSDLIPLASWLKDDTSHNRLRFRLSWGAIERWYEIVLAQRLARVKARPRILSMTYRRLVIKGSRGEPRPCWIGFGVLTSLITFLWRLKPDRTPQIFPIPVQSQNLKVSNSTFVVLYHLVAHLGWWRTWDGSKPGESGWVD